MRKTQQNTSSSKEFLKVQLRQIQLPSANHKMLSPQIQYKRNSTNDICSGSKLMSRKLSTVEGNAGTQPSLLHSSNSNQQTMNKTVITPKSCQKFEDILKKNLFRKLKQKESDLIQKSTFFDKEKNSLSNSQKFLQFNENISRTISQQKLQNLSPCKNFSPSISPGVSPGRDFKMDDKRLYTKIFKSNSKDIEQKIINKDNYIEIEHKDLKKTYLMTENFEQQIMLETFIKDLVTNLQTKFQEQIQNEIANVKLQSNKKIDSMIYQLDQQTKILDQQQADIKLLKNKLDLTLQQQEFQKLKQNQSILEGQQIHLEQQFKISIQNQESVHKQFKNKLDLIQQKFDKKVQSSEEMHQENQEMKNIILEQQNQIFFLQDQEQKFTHLLQNLDQENQTMLINQDQTFQHQLYSSHIEDSPAPKQSQKIKKKKKYMKIQDNQNQLLADNSIVNDSEESSFNYLGKQQFEESQMMLQNKVYQNAMQKKQYSFKLNLSDIQNSDLSENDNNQFCQIQQMNQQNLIQQNVNQQQQLLQKQLQQQEIQQHQLQLQQQKQNEILQLKEFQKKLELKSKLKKNN